MEDLRCMVCFTCDDLTDFVEQGGSGYWKASADSISWANYLICIKNKNGSNSKWKSDNDEHRQAFMIAKINEQGYIDAGKRKVITFDEYALLDDEIAPIIKWKGQSPIAYYTKEQLLQDSSGIDNFSNGVFDPSKLNWKSFSELKNEVEDKSPLKLSIKD